jgi:hypothetical protein
MSAFRGTGRSCGCVACSLQLCDRSTKIVRIHRTAPFCRCRCSTAPLTSAPQINHLRTCGGISKGVIWGYIGDDNRFLVLLESAIHG